jgi:hypothetical protein
MVACNTQHSQVSGLYVIPQFEQHAVLWKLGLVSKFCVKV